ncbi:MAG TPA: metal-dependent hydrolase [Anaerolineae bacterium]|nr:metal-dependent hydrolase [Anaerolineae bacterium]HIQ06587.1 metal-dependent hydrolase [Anaerolineae bacterium]
MSVRVTYYGHAAFGLEGDDTRLLIDPYFTDNPQAAASADEVDANYILVSHGHGDHVGDTVAIARRTSATVVSNFEIVSWLEQQGVEKTHPLHIGGSWKFPFGRVKMTIAHHGSSLPDGSYGGNPGGFLIELAGRKIYYAGDTGLTYDMKWLADDGVDLALLCIGDNFTMGPDDAIKAVRLIEPGLVIPYHYGTWPYIDVDTKDFQARCEAETGVKVILLAPGESYTL